LDDLEHQNKGFIEFFSDFWLRHTFQERTTPKILQIDQDNLQTKFAALHVDFNSHSLDPLDSRSAHTGIKNGYPIKSRYFTAVGSSRVKTVAKRHTNLLLGSNMNCWRTSKGHQHLNPQNTGF